MASKGLVSDERARTLIHAPDVATLEEISKLAQEVIDERQNATLKTINGDTVLEQQREIVALRARIGVLTKMVAETPIEQLVENVKAARLQTSADRVGE